MKLGTSFFKSYLPFICYLLSTSYHGWCSKLCR